MDQAQHRIGVDPNGRQAPVYRYTGLNPSTLGNRFSIWFPSWYVNSEDEGYGAAGSVAQREIVIIGGCPACRVGVLDAVYRPAVAQTVVPYMGDWRSRECNRDAFGR
ncbi:uncharacterized protein LOC129587218 [Paramacrobiotus metropolitanus]|uniref:uncharacterized protein LOC129587218 n=1 Tax=Paramacrobiotus metropolitanus TaxID=2943436 RepID=UPI002445BF92|nr:uncharacterized protein LOC129587218 [Paramacrobiotus metropolitanus]